MTSLGYHVPYLSTYFVCACSFVDYIFMIGVYLETYTDENRYILSWYSNSFMITTFYCLRLLFVVSKRICSMSACFILLCPLALIFGEVYLHSCASLTIFQMCFFTLSLSTSFAFHLASSLHLNKLVDLFYLSSLVYVYGKYMIRTMCHIY